MSAPIGRTVTIDENEIYYEERGGGEPLVLLHGVTGTHADWQHVFDLASLAECYRVIAPDARGHGRSTNRRADFTFRRCALDVLALLDHLGVERARAVGMSLGAKTLLHVATLDPSRVERMILVSGTPRFPEATRAVFRAAAAAPHSPEEWTAMRAQHAHGDAQIAALWKLPAAFAADPVDMTFTAQRLAAIEATTFVVAGDRDPLYPVELAVELYRGIARSSLWVVPDGGHGPIFNDQRDEFVRRALPFLRAP
ncbi:MAG TPA: alpha/beta hydrolase [Polyangiaceae bacterium]|nr:alpha/beta hydrolase [Polyangiaceae bacterium]